MIEATTHLQSTQKGILPRRNLVSTSLENTIIFKTKFSNIYNKNNIKNLLQKHLHFSSTPERNFNFKRSIICFKKDKNLQEILTPAKLQVPSNLLKEFN